MHSSKVYYFSYAIFCGGGRHTGQRLDLWFLLQAACVQPHLAGLHARGRRALLCLAQRLRPVHPRTVPASGAVLRAASEAAGCVKSQPYVLLQGLRAHSRSQVARNSMALSGRAQAAAAQACASSVPTERCRYSASILFCTRRC